MEHGPDQKTTDKAVTHPRNFSLKGFRQIIVRVYAAISDHQIGIISAGIAFYFFLSVIPGLAGIIALYGLISDASVITEQLRQLEGIMPAAMLEFLTGQLQQITQNNKTAGWSLVLAIIIAFYGASKAMNAIIISLNIAYREKESRNLFKRRLEALILTACSILFVVLLFLLLAGVPILFRLIGLDDALKASLYWLRWPLILIICSVWIAAIYRYAPHREAARWSWVSWGSSVAAILWLLGSALMSYVSANIYDYGATYGSLGVVVVCLFWFYLSSYALMLGAIINSEMELQTKCDTTTGKPKPIGERGAYVADHVAESLSENISDPLAQPKTDE